MQISFVASEGVPFSKTGGLADVVGALPRAVAALGHQVSVYLPRYRQTKLTDAKTVVFMVKLKAGVKMQMQSWMYDADGKELAGAYFADVRRKDAK